MRLSSKRQTLIPKPIRALHGWDNGQEFIIEEEEQGLLLRKYTPSCFNKTSLAQVAGCLKKHYQGKPITSGLRKWTKLLQKVFRKALNDCSR